MMRQSNRADQVSSMMSAISQEIGSVESRLAQLRSKLATAIETLALELAQQDAPNCAGPELSSTTGSGSGSAIDAPDSNLTVVASALAAIEATTAMDEMATGVVLLTLKTSAESENPGSEQNGKGDASALQQAAVEGEGEALADNIREGNDEIGAVACTPDASETPNPLNNAAVTDSKADRTCECGVNLEPKPLSLASADDAATSIDSVPCHVADQTVICNEGSTGSNVVTESPTEKADEKKVVEVDHASDFALAANPALAVPTTPRDATSAASAYAEDKSSEATGAARGINRHHIRTRLLAASIAFGLLATVVVSPSFWPHTIVRPYLQLSMGG